MNEKFALFVGTVVMVMAAVWFLTYLAFEFLIYSIPIIGVTILWWQWVNRR